MNDVRRIGVAFPGDPNRRSTWSGTPSGVVRGLADAGVEVVAVDVEPRPLPRVVANSMLAVPYLRPRRNVRAMLSAARAAARISPRLNAVYSRSGSGAVRRAGRLDGIVQIGTGYALNTSVPIVTLEDMTVVQTRTHPYSGWDLLSQRAFDARVAAQRGVYEQAAACCLTSHWAAESVIRDYGVPASKVHVVGLGRNHNPPAVEHDWSRPRFLFVGLDWNRKNGAGVLKAFSRLHAELPAAHLDVVGDHPPLDQAGVTAHGVLQLGVPEQQARLEQLFGTATCFVLPSHVEASAIAYIEAAAAGLPSIGTKSGGSDYLIGDGGVVVDPNDNVALLDAMRRLSDPDTAAQMGAAARRRSEMFTWPAVGRRLLEALDGRDRS